MPLNKVNYVHGQTIISAQNMNDIQDEVIRLGENQINLRNQMMIQPNYEQNDNTAIDYIKNRPFYNSTVYKSYHRYSLENPKYVTHTDITRSGYYELLNGEYGSDISDLFLGSTASFVKDQEYLIDISGQQFIYKARIDDSSLPEPIVYLGNASLIDKTIFEDTGEVFCIAHVTYDNTHVFITFGDTRDYNFFIGGVNYTLAIAKIVSEFKTIDPIFLPEATATTKGAVLVDDILNKDSKNAISNSAVFTQFENKVDKVSGKGLSDVNFTKEYEDEVKSIDVLRLNMDNINIRCGDLEDLAFACSAAAARATEIITNPYGAYLNSQVLTNEMLKINLGENSDKVFVQGNTFFVKLSEKVPSMEEMTKGVTIILSMVSGESPYGGYPSWTPVLFPITYIHVGDIRVDNEGWNFINSNAELFNGGKKFLGEWLISIEDSNNEYELPVGIYTTMDMSNLPGIMCSGLQINGFDLNSSSAPASREQVGDISAILDSIIGEEVWTFTLEDGSIVDKVVISSD